MNRIYRSIWNQATGAYSAVSENVNSAGKRTMPGGGGAVAQFALKALAASMMLGFGSLALAAPTGGVVVAGTANIGGQPGATVIDQGSQNAVINWASFNIGKNETVTFRQPNSNSVALNRVLGADGTSIMGNLSANGKVFLVNPNGVMFGKGSSVNVGGLVASTLDIGNADFMAGNYKFSGNGGKVLNQGAISAPGGYVALLGANVSNEGTISARLGSVVLAAGKAITLDVAGDGLLNVTVDQGAVNALVNNGGMLQADGGHVLLSAQAAGELLKTVVNNTGVIEARTIDTRGGTIKLLGDMQTGTVNAGGTLDASAPNGGNGGFIETSAAHVNIADGIHVTAQAATGLTGTWLIDPVDFTIAASGGNITGTDLGNSLKAADVQIQSTAGNGGTAGDINVNDGVSWSANKLTLTAQNNINVNAAMHGSGTASLALEYGQANVAAGNASAYKVNAAIDLPSGNTFSTRLGSNGDAVAYTVIHTLGDAASMSGTDLQGMRGDLTRNYALGSNIDASATASWNGGAGFTPVGNQSGGFTGKFDGLGHDIAGLAIKRAEVRSGLFGEIGLAGVVRNVNILGASIQALGYGYGRNGDFRGGFWHVGILAGRNQGLVANVRASGGLTIAQYTTGGGLVGYNDGTITNSASSVAVSGNRTIGGLVGETSASSKILASYATGAVSGDQMTGGLVGINNGVIANTYATGNVTGIANGGYYNGGLAGYNIGGGNISNSYATGNVSGRQSTGGIVGLNTAILDNVYSSGSVSAGFRSGAAVGFNNSGSVTNAYFNTTANASMPGIGYAVTNNPAKNVATGLSAAQMLVPANFTSFNFTSTPGLSGNNWVTVGANSAVNGSGGTLPMLSAEYSTTIGSAHQLQLMALNLAGIYHLGTSLSAATTTAGDVWATGGFIPVGTSTTPFTGSLNGAGHIVSGLTIAQSGVSDVGLFGVIGSSGAVANLGLAGGAVTGSLNVGALAGTNLGTISGSFASTRVIGDASGGGGLVGNNSGAIKDSYASGFVGGNNTMGGLVGTNSGTVATSYANGQVSTGAFGGGLVGVGAGSVSGSYWDTTTSGQSVSAGGTGFTTGELKTMANYNSATAANGVRNPAWDLASMWLIYDGQSVPLLRSFMTPLTITVANGTKVYDGSAGSTGSNSVTYSGLVDSNLLLGTPVFTGESDAAVNVGTYAVNASGMYSTSQTGYLISYVAGGLSITAKALTVTGATGITRVYDGGTGVAIAGGTLSGLVGTETLNLSGLAGSYADKTAGTGKAITVTGATLGDGSGLASNYTVVNPTTVSGTIDKATIAGISGLHAADKVYDGTTAATLAGTAVLNGMVAGDNIVVSAATGAFSDKNAGAAKTVYLASITLSGSDVLNYTFGKNSDTMLASITPKALTVSGASAANRVYDGTLAATIGGATLSGLVGAETLDLTALTGTFADKNVGTGKSVAVSATLGDGANGGLASNYTVTSPTGLLADVTRASISSISAMQANSKVYNGDTSATLDSASGTFNGMVSGDSLSASATNATFDSKNVGTAKTVALTGLVLGGTDAGNYNLASSTGSATGAITPKAVTITGMSAVNKTYDGTDRVSLSGGSLAGLVGTETLGVTGLSATFDDKNAGTGKRVSATGSTLVNGGNGGLAANYTITNPTGLSANITPKALTVSGMTATTKVYDGLLAATLAGGALSGLVAGETLVLSGATGVFLDKNAGTNKAVTVRGSAIADATGLASNYSVVNPSTVTGTITQKTLTVSGSTAANKTYDGLTTASIAGGTLDGLVSGETLVFTGGSGAFVDQNAGTNKAVTVSGSTIADATGLASNYSVSNPTGVTASITQKALTVTGLGAADKVYDGTTVAQIAGGTLHGLVGAETLGIAGQTASFSDKNAAHGKAVTVTGTTLVNGVLGLASNYTVSNPTGLTATISRAALTGVTGLKADNKVYDGTTSATVSSANAAFSGMVRGDSLALTGGSGAFNDKNAAANKTVTVSGLTLLGADAGNYAFGGTASTLATITQAPLAVKVGDAAKDQGRVNPSFSASYAGLVGGDTLAASVTGTLVFTTDATTASIPASYLVAAAGQASTNYALTYTPGVLTVNPTEILQNAINSAVASATVTPAQGTMVAAETSNGITPVQEPLADIGRAKGTQTVRQNGNVVVEALPGLNLVVVKRGLLLPAELAEALAPGGSD